MPGSGFLTLAGYSCLTGGGGTGGASLTGYYFETCFVIIILFWSGFEGTSSATFLSTICGESCNTNFISSLLS